VGQAETDVDKLALHLYFKFLALTIYTG